MNKILKILLVVICIVIIFSFSLQTGSDSSSTSNKILDVILNIFNINVSDDLYVTFGLILRKLSHFTEFLILSLLTYNLFKNYLYTFIFCVCIASLDEFIQTFVPNRSGNIIDVCIDSLGVLVALTIIYFVRRKKDD